VRPIFVAHVVPDASKVLLRLARVCLTRRTPTAAALPEAERTAAAHVIMPGKPPRLG